MEVNWTNEAIESLRETFLKEKPTQLSRFIEKIKLYKILIMKGKFALYYDFIEEESVIIIKFFRSTKQKPLGE
jgi:hypothetical protein